MHSMGKRERGFSMIELLVVVAIILIVAAMAVPQAMTAMDDIRLNSSLRDLIGLAQQAREQAVKNNDFYQLVLNNNALVFVDGPIKNPQTGDLLTPRNATMDAREPAVQLPQRVTITSAGAPAFGQDLGGSAVPLSGQLPAFNARGQACFPQGMTCTTRQGGMVPGASGATVAYVFYLNQQRTFGAPAWAAISVAPGGKMKAWMYERSTGNWKAQ